MPETRAEVRMLGDSYTREMRSLLYHAYRHEPTFAYLLESDRPGFDQRVRATIRELTHQHMLEDLPVLGLVIDERLVAVALIAPPQRRLGITESWAWRMRMLLTTGFRCTRRYLEYHEAVLGCLPPGPYHVLPLIGVHPEFQGKHLGEQLLEALHAWCAEDGGSQGLVLDTGNARYLDFYHRHGYEEVGEVALGPIREHVLFHPNPQSAAQLSRQGTGL
ncbi:GNAT family N-acetyltransferase [Pseudomonas knackmussii]|uniref:GNAT family N-acetyltransferase n=1 Tax=Pseudomonas knackmussii TaxID=65741 RepID=UPI003BE95A31